MVIGEFDDGTGTAGDLGWGREREAGHGRAGRGLEGSSEVATAISPLHVL